MQTFGGRVYENQRVGDFDAPNPLSWANVPTCGKKVGLSTTACCNRIRRLESDGVITRRVALAGPVKAQMLDLLGKHGG